MKIILLHSDFVEFEPKKEAIKEPEKVEKKKSRIEECLVVLSSVEKKDEGSLQAIVKKFVENVEDVAKQIKVKRIVIYPWVHLSNDPSSPSAALEVFKEAEKLLKKQFEVKRAPFGWYKEFSIKCKGHPLAELSREITAEKEEVSQALKAEEKLESEWFILTTDGKLHKIEMKDKKIMGFDFSKYKNLEKMVLYEMAKSRDVKEEPPHVKLMRKLELVDYEEGSDPGNLRYPPKGRMVKALLEELVTREVLKYGAMEIEAPIMYDYEHPSLKSYLNRFPARQYTIVTPNKKVFLRFAACFGQFLMLHDAVVSYKQMPIRMYELTRYSFRVEKSGELVGLKRLRAFTMPDCHAFCMDMKQAKEEMMKRLELAKNIQNSIGLNFSNDFEFAIRVVKPFWDEHKDHVINLVKNFGKPALIEMWNKQFFYFVLKYEWNFVDASEKASCLTTDQIDIENGERYNLKYVDKDGKEKHPLILHLSPSGAIERVMYALLEKAYLEQKAGKVPQLPLWLSPTQIRLCTVSHQFNEFAEKLANSIEKNNIRIDIDDRDETISRKIRDAESEWIPIILVIGEKEKSKSKFIARIRGTKEMKEMNEKELIEYVNKKTRGMPFRPLPMSKLISQRPKFIG